MVSQSVWKSPHQYVDRRTSAARTEELFGDPLVSFLYAPLWENGPALYPLLTAAWSSRLIGFLRYDAMLGAGARSTRKYLERCGVHLDECLEPLERLDTPRKLFERKIRYWTCRPMPAEEDTAVSPADGRVLVGSLAENSALFLKGKFFDAEELVGKASREWSRLFSGGDFAILRLTPEKYHYNHVPVAGRVLDFYELPGSYHACNPGAVVTVITPHSKNRRAVTILDTDVPGGTKVGVVAMIEVAALMVGEVVQCHSAERYHAPRPISRGDFLNKGAVKSLFRPGGSTVVLLFQSRRIRFADDIVKNLTRPGVLSRYSLGFGRTLVETDIPVRSLLARRSERPSAAEDYSPAVLEASHGQ